MSWLGDEIKKEAATSQPTPERTLDGAFHTMQNKNGLCSFIVEDREDPNLVAGIVVHDKATSKNPRTRNAAGISG